MTTKQKTIKIRLKKSTIALTKEKIATVRGLGLKKINSEKELLNTPANRGMIKKVIHLLDILE